MMIPSLDHSQIDTSQEDDGDGHKKSSPWGRVKWIDKMVKLMITALSYLGDDGNKHARKGKWRAVSEVMDQKGYHVSPQQCEDKFNDLNKRYKRLNVMLGRGTSCEVVENPALLDEIDYLDEKEKKEVRKIMSSKNLCYEEMCSYLNGNRLHLPHDPALQRSLRLRCHDNDEHNEDLDDGDDCEEHHMSHDKDCVGGHHGALGGSLKRLRQSQSHEDIGLLNHANKGRVPHLESRYLELEERKLQIQGELMELERQRIKWERFSQKRDQELQRMRMENENMKLENEKMKLELRGVELGARF